MKLLAPCADPAEVEPLLRAGADALYCGLFDGAWLRRWGPAAWPNRRGPGPANLPGEAALDAVVEAAHQGGATVQLTLNAPLLSPDQEEATLATADDALDRGVDALVVAAPPRLAELRRRPPPPPQGATPARPWWPAPCVRPARRRRCACWRSWARTG